MPRSPPQQRIQRQLDAVDAGAVRIGRRPTILRSPDEGTYSRWPLSCDHTPGMARTAATSLRQKGARHRHPLPPAIGRATQRGIVHARTLQGGR